MNLFELLVKIGVNDQASGKIAKLSQNLGNGLKTAGKIGVAAVSAAAAGITALTTASINSYAEYEQLVGGSKLMFGDAYDYIAQRSSEAYKNVQMSQNDYLQQVNGFATGLKTALGGNEQAAAELADRIVTAEADVVAATGNTAENVQNAFNGIMKSNFTMLDNLQLGITPTKEGFQQLIDQVNAWNAEQGKATDYQIDNLADAQSALIDYIEMQGLANYAAMEGAQTISGSLAAAKASLSDLIAGLSNDEADLELLINNFVDSVSTAADNILPRIDVALNGAVELITALAPKIIARVPELFNEILPSVLEGAMKIVNAIIQAIPGLLSSVLNAMTKQSHLIIQNVLDTLLLVGRELVKNIPVIIDAIAEIGEAMVMWILEYSYIFGQTGSDLIKSLADGLAEYLPKIIPAVIDIILEMVDVLTEPDNLMNLVDAAIEIIIALADGLIEALPKLLERAPEIIANLVEALIRAVPKLGEAAIAIMEKLFNGIHEGIPKLLTSAGDIIGQLVTAFANLLPQVLEIGKNIVSGVWQGIQDMKDTFFANVKNFFSGIVDGVKRILGIQSPSKVFAQIGEYMAQGVGIGWGNAFGKVKTDIDDSMDFDAKPVPVDFPDDFDGPRRSGAGGLSIVQHIHSMAQTAADLMEEAEYKAEEAVLGLV